MEERSGVWAAPPFCRLILQVASFYSLELIEQQLIVTLNSSV